MGAACGTQRGSTPAAAHRDAYREGIGSAESLDSNANSDDCNASTSAVLSFRAPPPAHMGTEGRTGGLPQFGRLSTHPPLHSRPPHSDSPGANGGAAKCGSCDALDDEVDTYLDISTSQLVLMQAPPPIQVVFHSFPPRSYERDLVVRVMQSVAYDSVYLRDLVRAASGLPAAYEFLPLDGAPPMAIDRLQLLALLRLHAQSDTSNTARADVNSLTASRDDAEIVTTSPSHQLMSVAMTSLLCAHDQPRNLSSSERTRVYI